MSNDDFARGIELEKAGDLENARDAYFMAMLDPLAAVGVELRLVAVLAQLGQTDEALELASRLEERGVSSVTIDVAKAVAYEYLEDWPAAEAAAKKATGQAATSLHGWLVLARALRSQQRRAEASVAAAQVTELAADWAIGWFELANDYAALGQLTNAIEAVGRCVALEPAQGDGWYNLACYRARIGDSAGALEALGLAIRIAPENAKIAVADTDFRELVGDARFIAITA